MYQVNTLPTQYSAPCLITIADNPFQGAYTVGPEKVERHDHGDAQHLEARRKASPDETYQKAFDRLQKSIARAEKEVRHQHHLLVQISS